MELETKESTQLTQVAKMKPGLTLEREARLIGEPICYDKELERSLAINAKIGKNIYFAFGLTSDSHYLDIGLTFILTSASHSF